MTLSKLTGEKEPDNRPDSTYTLVDTKTDKVLYEWVGKGLELHIEEFNKQLEETGKPLKLDVYEAGANERYAWFVERP